MLIVDARWRMAVLTVYGMAAHQAKDFGSRAANSSLVFRAKVRQRILANRQVCVLKRFHWMFAKLTPFIPIPTGVSCWEAVGNPCHLQ
ncbi:MAG: hypothetical protein Q7O66_19410 [Dehalococcoidia bacterium]|nr:hypothetical protein [Dehalococcoidia bacterium]